jgi:phosphatidylinositol alpha-1,6-mannosyltransferase
MKTLLITDVFPPQVGGSGRWLFEVYRRLPREKIVIAAGEHPQAGAFDKVHGMEIERLPLKFDTWGFFESQGLRQYGVAARRLAKLCRDRKISVVHCGTLLPEGWLAWLLKRWLGLPYWVFVHGEELRVGQQSRQLGWMMRRVLHGAEGVIANSQNTAGLLIHSWKVSAAKVHVINPGCDCELFVPQPRDAMLRDKMRWNGRHVVLTVGRLQKRKGQDMLIRALPVIRHRVNDVLYAIVGDGEERETLEALADANGVREHVQFMGEACGDVLRQCYQQCDLFVLPNREVDGDFEGFGMVLVEAQACGRPVVAGESGGTRETMQVRQAADDQETGVIVDCTRPDPLAEAVCELLLDEPRREEMGRAGRDWVVSQFDWPGVSERVAFAAGIVPR